jgi:mannose-6-phosphate isomerase-like protein (cupin superfamily)
MQDKIKQVASRIRELREIFGASVPELARAFQVPEQDYLQYESGTVDIPVGILYQIAQRFGVELTTLITGEEPRLRTYALTRKDQGISVDRRKAYGYQSLAYNFIRKRAEPFLITVEPAPEDAPEHVNSHPGQEFHYVLEGTLRVMLDQHELVLEPGDSLYFDSSVPHSLAALNQAPVKLLAVIL